MPSNPTHKPELKLWWGQENAIREGGGWREITGGADDRHVTIAGPFQTSYTSNAVRAQETRSWPHEIGQTFLEVVKKAIRLATKAPEAKAARLMETRNIWTVTCLHSLLVTCCMLAMHKLKLIYIPCTKRLFAEQRAAAVHQRQQTSAPMSAKQCTNVSKTAANAEASLHFAAACAKRHHEAAKKKKLLTLLSSELFTQRQSCGTRELVPRTPT